MILKVPIYVEIEKLPEGVDLKEEMKVFGRSLTLYLQGKQHSPYLKPTLDTLTTKFGDFKILSHEKALEVLRKK